MIDLDLLAPEEASSEPYPVNLRRRWLTVGTLLGVLLVAAGASVPPPPGLPAVRTVSVVTSGVYRLLGDTLVTAESRPDGNWVTAYPLAPGPARWATRVGVLSDAVSLDAVGDVILVSMAEPGVGGDHTVALDRRTGAVRWHSPLIMIAVDQVRAHVVLTEYLATGTGGGLPPARIAVLDAGTGASVWGFVRDGDCQTDVPYTVTSPGTGVAVLCQGEVGTLSVLDLGSGRVRAHTDVPGGGRATMLAGLVVTDTLAIDRTVVSAYDATTLAQVWSSSVEPGNYGLSDCGTRICLTTARAEIVLDRGTGRVAWQTGPVGFATPLARYVVVDPAGRGDVELLDVDTGRNLMQLGSWTLDPGSTASLTLYQADGATGHTWLARLRPGSATVEVLGFVPDARAETCVSSTGYLVCRTVDSTVGVWRYRV